MAFNENTRVKIPAILHLCKCLVPLSNGQDSDKKVLGYF